MLSCKRDYFDLDDDVHYLNCAYMSPVSKRVEAAGISGIRMKRNPQVVQPHDFFETSARVRTLFASLVGATEERISIIPSVSYGVAVAAKNIPLEQGDNIVVVSEQFPSNVYTWRRLAEEKGARIHFVSPPDVLKQRGTLWNTRILEQINAKTAVVAMGHVHWADGTLFDLAAIGERARQVDAAFIIDGTQSVGALPFNVRDIKPDALICAGYKWLLGPYGIGVAYWGPRFDDGIPLEENWISRKGSEQFGGLVSYQDQYQPGAVRYDVGERSNFILMPMLEAALSHLVEWEVDAIQQYCDHLIQPFIHAIQQLGYWVEAPQDRSSHLFGVRVRESGLMDRLRANLKSASISVSSRGDAVRISPNVYNTATNIDALVEAFSRAMDRAQPFISH